METSIELELKDLRVMYKMLSNRVAMEEELNEEELATWEKLCHLINKALEDKEMPASL